MGINGQNEGPSGEMEEIKNKEAVQEIITHDPFYQNEIAQYEIIEFEASKYCPEFETIISKTFDDKSLD